MATYSLPKYEKYRVWIRDARNNGMEWEKIMFAGESDAEGLNEFLAANRKYNYWDIDKNDWFALVQLQKKAEEQTKAIIVESQQALICDEGEDNGADIPTDPHSCWQIYRRNLIEEKKFDEKVVIDLENSVFRILRRLNRDTRESGPVKGLVIGNVQSGKTANMAGLMAMAADWGWNMVIVLSGTIENLRQQTQRRLYNDLKSNGNLRWTPLEHLSKKSTFGQRAQDLNFGDDSYDRYFTVCLKNKGRLKKLIQWLQLDKNKMQQMRILVIDDEADQAGINTADITAQERRAINKLICALVNGNNEKDEKSNHKYMAMNYIGYTATPYANILNDSDKDSLYPRSFISTLGVSKEYFGPQQIFGVAGGDYDGMDIIRTIPPADLERIKNIHNCEVISVPETMENSIAWFFCCVACLRYWKYGKPVSMLVHTSSKTDDHKNVYDAIIRWFKQHDKEDILNKCRAVWEQETGQFSLEKFREQYPDYSRSDALRDYPDFSEIEEEIAKLIGRAPSHIPLDEEDELAYHEGVHICIDNCKNNGVQDEMYVRLAYPSEDNMPEPAPAFIVIGGATLSRGLTIQGLVSTFFLRSVNQADTLMQMGRWFGYRRGYELLPRVWLTERSINQFSFLSVLDQELRNEIYDMDITGKIPANYGPKLKNTPSYKLIRITAKNRMQSAQLSDMDYSGSFNQTYLFDNDYDVLHSNAVITKAFVESLGAPENHKKINAHSKHCAIWRNVDNEIISNYLKSYHFNKHLHFANNLDAFLEWIEKLVSNGKLNKWNVVFSGASEEETADSVPFGTVHVKKVRRSRKKMRGSDEPAPDRLDIGVLRSPLDIIADIDLENADRKIVEEMSGEIASSRAKTLRNEAGLDTTPQLIIYLVDAESKARKKENSARVDLNAPDDIIGLCINIPGGKAGVNYARTVSIKLDPVTDDEGDLDI